jgi:hypothetical protein
MFQPQSRRQGYGGANFVLLVRGRYGLNQVSIHLTRRAAEKRANVFEGETLIARIKHGKLVA